MNTNLKLWFLQIRKNSFHNMSIEELRKYGSIICVPGDLLLETIRGTHEDPNKGLHRPVVYGNDTNPSHGTVHLGSRD